MVDFEAEGEKEHARGEVETRNKTHAVELKNWVAAQTPTAH